MKKKIFKYKKGEVLPNFLNPNKLKNVKFGTDVIVRFNENYIPVITSINTDENTAVIVVTHPDRKVEEECLVVID